MNTESLVKTSVFIPHVGLSDTDFQEPSISAYFSFAFSLPHPSKLFHAGS